MTAIMLYTKPEHYPVYITSGFTAFIFPLGKMTAVSMMNSGLMAILNTITIGITLRRISANFRN